jgi:Plasmid pRiA4b ORF-3-like protein
VQLAEVNPVVWRRVLVPGAVRMAKLSEMILAVMGWTNSHLHAFRVSEKRYGMCLRNSQDLWIGFPD